MKVAQLAVSEQPDSDGQSRILSFRLTLEDKGISSGEETKLGKLSERMAEGRATGSEVAQLLPQDVIQALRQWYYDSGTSAILAIVSHSATVDVIPWERASPAIGLPDLCIVRLLHAPGLYSPAGELRNALLVAGWVGAPTLHLSGIQDELAALARLDFPESTDVRVMAEPTVQSLQDAWCTALPRCVHLAAPAVVYEESGPKIAISGIDALELVSVDALLSGLHGITARLVILNTCDGAFGGNRTSAARLIAERLGAMAISWYGTVGDREAADFASYFYSRMLEGDTVVNSIRQFNRMRLISSSVDRSTRGVNLAEDGVFAVPVLWTPSIDALGVQLLTHLEPAVSITAAMPRAGHVTDAIAAAEGEPVRVWVEFEPQRWLNPALLKNQRPTIARLVINADRPLRGVRVTITCDTGAGQSTIGVTIDLARGPQPVKVDHLHFPVLYQLIEQGAGRRWINFTVRCMYLASVVTENTSSVLWMGLSEWLDRKDMWHFIPAFVNPNDDAVLKVLDEADRVLKKFDPKNAFDGYQRNDVSFVERQVEALFSCLRDEPFELSYVNVPPLQVYVPDDSMPSGQRVRTPTEVIQHRRGTCHDLAILFASCLEHIGIHPLVVLAPGHTYGAYWTDEKAWQNFWKQAGANAVRLPQIAGRNWIISSVDELTSLVDSRAVILLEATRITDRNARFADSTTEGRANLRDLGGLDVAVDIRASRRFVQPL